MAVTKRPARSIDKMGGGDLAALVHELDDEIGAAWRIMNYFRRRAKKEDSISIKIMAHDRRVMLLTLLRIREAGLNRVNKLWN